MECASCHAVHDNTNVPFLQRDIDTLCAHCHQTRQYVGNAASTGEGAWGNYYGWTLTGANSNPGSHPVGNNVTGDNSGAGNSPITWNATIALKLYGADRAHNLGAHMINGATTDGSGGMGCATCHAVHGVQAEGVGASGPFEDVLAVKGGSNGGRGRGDGQANNALCEACHRGDVPGFAGDANLFPNPGAVTKYTHPADDYTDNNCDFGVTAFPTNWPVGAGTGNTPYVICESCHDAHPLAATGNDGIGGTVSNTHILRYTETVVCDQCHTAGTIVNHHPVGAGLLGTRFVDAAIGNQDTDLTCSDCHNGTGAHNWGSAGVGLDPEWEPLDNGRTADTGAGVQIANSSKECFDCHVGGASSDSLNPTRATAGGYLAHSAALQSSGNGSHYVGDISAAWTLGKAGVNTNFTTSNWAGGGWSRLGAATNGQVVCESCHELEPAKNVEVFSNALLLHDYVDAYNQDHSDLCEGCHSHNATATGNAHPMSGDTITKAVLNNVSPTTLVTAAGRYAVATPTVYATYPSADKMNCDSCHQTHQADTNSATYIMETNAAGSAVTGTPADGVSIYGYSKTAVRYPSGGAGLDYTAFCGLCHTTGF